MPRADDSPTEAVLDLGPLASAVRRSLNGDHPGETGTMLPPLVDLEDNFQLWRFRHLKTVERIIGSKTGTGGSSGAPFLRRALELTFFPELYAVRTEIPG